MLEVGKGVMASVYSLCLHWGFAEKSRRNRGLKKN